MWQIIAPISLVVTEIGPTQLSLFSMIPSVLTYEFDLILGSYLSFWGLNWLFLGLSSKSVGESTHVGVQLSFCMFYQFWYWLLLNFGDIFYF